MFAIRVEPDKEEGPILIVNLDTDEVHYVKYVQLLGLVTVKSIPMSIPPEQFKASRVWVEAEDVEF